MYRALFCVVASLLCCLPLTARGTSRLTVRLKQFEDEFAWYQAEQKRLQQLADNELIETFSKLKIEWQDWPYNKKLNHEMLLTEMVRRGDKAFEKVIIEKMQTQQKALQEEEARQRKKEDEKEKGINVKTAGREYHSPENLPMLTALRRIQKKPDPMAIEVKQLGTESTTRELPRFNVVLKNVDVEKQPFHFSFGGDYRSGRFTRCTFEVRDAQGKKLSPRHWEASMGGGMFQMGNLEYGKTWSTELPLGSYAKITEPGEYTVRVLYHNTSSIADYSDLTGIIVSASESFKISVGKPIPRKVLVRAGSNEKVTSLIRSLKEKKSVRTVCSKYDKDLYSFINPTSPEGQLLLMEWNAVPGLLDLLKDKTLTQEQRAWIFVMLHTLTDADDMSPFVQNVTSRFSHTAGVIGDYAYRGIGCFGSGGGTISPSLQQKFAEEWLTLAPELWSFVVADDATLTDWARLEGDWKLVSTMENGTAIQVTGSCRTRNGVAIVYHYIKDRDNTLFGENVVHQKGKYHIDGSRKTIDYDITQGLHQGKKLLGIYKIEDGLITYCFSAPSKERPSDFTCEPGSERILYVWKR